MNNKCLNIARDLVNEFLNRKEKGYVPDIDFVKKLLAHKEFELEQYGCKLSESDIELLSREINAKETISIDREPVYMSKDKKPWLHTLGNIETPYSDRYKKYLVAEEGFSRKVVEKIFDSTDNILDFMANPNDKNKPMLKKGLVMGNVQSGKTANYLSLINKATDVGYRLIILIAGIHNNLRTQTQARVNKGFIGYDKIQEERVGVSNFGDAKTPFSFTNTISDFNLTIARQIQFPEDTELPIILVIKKNSSTLKSLLKWFKSITETNNLKNFPMLMIDDEADNASVNTKKHPDEATKINIQLRQILSLFKIRSYVGYTATPFANIFINPEASQDEYGPDLFPEDFIVSLESPENYIGADKIFNKKSNFLRDINDNDDCLPTNLRNDDKVECLPISLKKAIQVFLLILGIRKIRKNRNLHNSMLINVSFRTAIQNQVKELVEEYLHSVLLNIKYTHKLSTNVMLSDSFIKELHNIWKEEFNEDEVSFVEILEQIVINEDLIKVFIVNSSTPKDERLNYDKYKDTGINAITIGGYSLSRGFTVEGLTVSYFLRTSKMYDTLLQMGRWFGYRPGYEDLCRIYMKKEVQGWYSHISDATNELKDDFELMNSHNLTPRDFGLKVKNHDEFLLITARNKMYHSSDAVISIDYYGDLIETRKLISSKDDIDKNRLLLENFLNNLPEPLTQNDKNNKNYIWKDINISLVEGFLVNFKNHISNIRTDSNILTKYFSKEGIRKFDIALISNQSDTCGSELISNFRVNYEKRTSLVNDTTIQVSGSKNRVGSISDEKCGLSDSSILKYKDDNNKNDVTGIDYRAIREKENLPPLLILHILNVFPNSKSTSADNISGVVAYGISFPGSSQGSKGKAVTYKVNQKWIEQFAEVEEEEIDYELQ